MKLIKYIVFITILSAVSMAVVYFSLQFFLAGKTPIAVPQIANETAAQAASELNKRGLKLRIDKVVFNEQLAAGVIISQVPPASIRVRKGDAVSVIVSKGPNLIKMPDVVGLSLREAMVRLHGTNLEIGNKTYIFATARENTVLAQAVAPDSFIAAHTSVDLLVSKGEKPQYFLMPRLTGLKLDTAESVALKMGLNIDKIGYNYDFLSLPGNVVGQSPVQNTVVKAGVPINLTVSALIQKKTPLSDLKMGWLRYTTPPGLVFKNVRIVAIHGAERRILYDKKSEPAFTISRIFFYKPPITIKIFINDFIKKELKWN